MIALPPLSLNSSTSPLMAPARLVAALFIALFLSANAVAQVVTSDQTGVELDRLEGQLTELSADVADAADLVNSAADEATLSEEIIRLENIRLELQSVENAANRIRDRAVEAIKEVEPLLEVAPPPPAAEQKTDDEPRQAEGTRPDPALQEVLAPVRDIKSRATVLVAKARLSQIDTRRLALELTMLRDRTAVSSALDRGPSPLSRSVWSNTVPKVSQAVTDILRGIAGWRADRIDEGKPMPLVILFIAAACAILALFVINRRFYRWQVRRFSERSPARQAVATAATTSFLLRLGLAIGAVIFLAGVAKLIGALDTIERSISISLAFAAIAVISARALVESVMAPRTKAFRLIAVGSTGAKAACFAFPALVIMFAIETVFEATGTMTSPGPNLLASGTFFLSLINAGLLCWLALKLKPNTETGSTWLRQTGRILLALLGLSIFVASLLGYSTLSRFLVERIVAISYVLLIAILARELLRATALSVLSGVVERRRYASARDDDPENSDAGSAIKGEFWVRILVDAAIVLVVPPFILLALGMPAQELWSEIRRLIEGAEIGGQRISLGKILSAMLTLASVLLATRLVQRGLVKNILPHTQISSGASNSLITLLGYAGVLVAGIAAISVVGFDLSSLAIIAGALSVGIGFGLQSIVSNFVAGLILLFERPFKIGDWIVTTSGEGVVRKINVRATEVETFDRQSIIVPNAELVSNSFGNWTHKSSIIRVIVPVTVRYGTDPRRIEALLLEAAESVSLVRSYPPSFVVFKDFGANGLEMQLRAFIIADDVVAAPSELRYAITEVFTREGITIPLPQRDIHVDWPDADRTSGVRNVSEAPEMPSSDDENG